MSGKRISQASSFSLFTEALPHYIECVSYLFCSNEVLLMSKRNNKQQRWDICQVESSLFGISMNEEKKSILKSSGAPLPRQHQINPENICNDPNFAFRNSLPLLLAAERVIGTILIYREGIESTYIGPLIC